MANGIQKDLGKVTAYSYAKAAGYTGTEEQFQAIFNEFTEDAPGLIDRMDTAVERAEAAVTNIDATIQDAVDDAVEEATASAVATANQAVTDAQAAQTAAEGAVTQANAAVTQANEAVTAAQAAQSAAEDAAESFVLDRTLTDSGAAAPADLVGDLKESFTQNIITTPKNKNLLDYTKTLANKYLNANGVMEDLNGRYVTDYIPVVAGKYAIFSYISTAIWTPTKMQPLATCFYDADKNVVTGGGYNEVKITPNNAAYVRLTIGNRVASTNYGMVSISDTNAAPESFSFYLGDDKKALSDELIIPDKAMGYMQTKGSLTDGESLTLPYHNVKINNVLVFTANITTFDKLKIGKENDAYIIIDDTNVTLYNDAGVQTPQAHGLTIENDIQVIIENTTAMGFSRITIVSTGVEFNLATGARFIMDNGSPYVISDGSTLTDCVFSWSSRNINTPIWLFGDSYFSWYPERWVYYLARDGFTDSCMLNGYAGESSINAYNALINLLKIRVPNYVVWCIGMNDGDSVSAVNSTWKIYYDAIIDLSNYYGFTLILATIPNTPTVKNNYKNAIIRNSGYRYIDFDKAVDPDGDGEWFPGAREENGVHPTKKGAKILYYQALADLPELTSN